MNTFIQRLDALLEDRDLASDPLQPWTPELRHQFSDLTWAAVAAMPLTTFEDLALRTGRIPVATAIISHACHGNPQALNVGTLRAVVLGQSPHGAVKLPMHLADNHRVVNACKHLFKVLLGGGEEPPPQSAQWMYTVAGNQNNTGREAYVYGIAIGDREVFLSEWAAMATASKGGGAKDSFAALINKLREEGYLHREQWAGWPEDFTMEDNGAATWTKHSSDYIAYTCQAHPHTIMIASFRVGEGCYLLKDQIELNWTMDARAAEDRTDSGDWSEMIKAFVIKPIRIAAGAAPAPEQGQEGEQPLVVAPERVRLQFRNYLHETGQGMFLHATALKAITAWSTGEDAEFMALAPGAPDSILESRQRRGRGRLMLRMESRLHQLSLE